MQPPSQPACWPQCSCYYLITRISVTGHSTHIHSQWQPSVRCTVSNYMRMNGWCHHWNWAFLSCSYFYECLKFFLWHGTDQSMENRWSWLGEFESFAAWSAWNIWFPNRILYFHRAREAAIRYITINWILWNYCSLTRLRSLPFSPLYRWFLCSSLYFLFITLKNTCCNFAWKLCEISMYFRSHEFTVDYGEHKAKYMGNHWNDARIQYIYTTHTHTQQLKRIIFIENERARENAHWR